MPLIDVQNLSVRYPRAAGPALNDVSFSVEQGETLLLLGPSGSGKSTIGLCLAGLIPASIPAVMQGTIMLDGQDAADLSVGERTARIGMVFQDPEAQFCMLTVEDEVAFGLENMAMPREEMAERISEALDRVGLGERRHERVDRLSGGQKQRLALACVLARRPAVLFLDEPTANLDPATRREFFEWLDRLRREQPDLTIIVVEHILDDLITLVDRVLLLRADGAIFRQRHARPGVRHHGRRAGTHGHLAATGHGAGAQTETGRPAPAASAPHRRAGSHRVRPPDPADGRRRVPGEKRLRRAVDDR